MLSAVVTKPLPVALSVAIVVMIGLFCPEHGLHGERDTCFVCDGPVEQVAMVPVLGGGAS